MRHQARRFQLAAFLLLGAAHASAQANKQPNEPPPPPPPVAEYSAKSWKELSSTEGRFSVLMVGAPQQQSQDVDTALGKITLHLFGAVSGAGTYIVMYGDFPAYPEDPASTRRALDGGRDRMLAAEKNDRLLGEKEITVEGHIARELFVEDGRTFIRMWMFMARERLYQVMLVAPLNVAFTTGRPSSDPKDWTDLYRSMGEKFFGSFKLLPATPPGGAVTSLPYGDPITRDAGADGEPKAQVSGGILNGRALKMPPPAYPPIAQAAGVSGDVSVKVVFDESGKVIWAKAVSGHEYLRQAAEEAARQATFPPMTVQGKPVRVSGILLYKFTRK